MVESLQFDLASFFDASLRFELSLLSLLPTCTSKICLQTRRNIVTMPQAWWIRQTNRLGQTASTSPVALVSFAMKRHLPDYFASPRRYSWNRFLLSLGLFLCNQLPPSISSGIPKYDDLNTINMLLALTVHLIWMVTGDCSSRFNKCWWSARYNSLTSLLPSPPFCDVCWISTATLIGTRTSTHFNGPMNFKRIWGLSSAPVIFFCSTNYWMPTAPVFWNVCNFSFTTDGRD